MSYRFFKQQMQRLLVVHLVFVLGLSACSGNGETDGNSPRGESQTTVVRTKNGALDWSITTPTKTCTVKVGTTERKVRC